jgi:DNA-binding protein HU-beta
VNKGEFAAALAERTELSKADANRALDGILDALTEAMAEHDEVSFSGWGKFGAQRRKGRDAHDPRNPGRTIHVAPAYVPKFKAGSVLKREVQEAQQPNIKSNGAGQRRPAPATPGVAVEGAQAGAEMHEQPWQDASPARWRPLGDR